MRDMVSGCMPSAESDLRGEMGRGDTEGGQEFLLKNFAGVDGGQFMACHGFSSMIVDNPHIVRLTALPTDLLLALHRSTV